MKRLPKNIFPDVRLEGSRIVLRPPAAGDWPQWHDVRHRNFDYLAPFEPEWPEDCLTEPFFLRRLEFQLAEWRLGRSYAFLIFDRDGEALIGGINLNNVCRGAAQFGSLGYWLDRDRQGHGYMTEALGLIAGFAFDELKLHRINASCLPYNERSRRLLLRLGFGEEGYALKYLQINGQWQDHLLFGLPVEAWKLSGNQA